MSGTETATKEEPGHAYARQATNFQEVVAAESGWDQYLEEVEENLLKLPLVAVLLPTETDKEANQVFNRLEEERVHVEAAAHTTYLNMPRTLWILDRDPADGDETVTPAIHLSTFVTLLSEKTQSFRAPVGPWIWPLHDSDVASAIVLSEVSDERAPWWRKILWGLRLVAPPSGGVVERCIMEHYGREVGYVFNWANLFTRGLWLLALPMLILGILDVGPGTVGAESSPWYCMQILVIAWGLGITAASSSRQAVLRSGAGLRRRMKHRKPAAPAPGVAPSPPQPEEAPLPHQVVETGADAAVVPNAEVTGAGATMTDHPVPAEPPESKPKQVPHPKRRVAGKQKGEGVKLAPKQLLQAKAGKTRKAVDVSKMETVFVHRNGPEKAKEQMQDFRLNPEYRDHPNIIRQRLIASLITVVSLSTFLAVAAAVLSVLLEMKSILIYEWGQCLRNSCDNAGAKWGALAILPDLGVDILMALVFIVGLGEACKALAFQLTRLFNFRLMRRRYLMQTLVALFIESLAKVGIFTLLAFLFLPSWGAAAMEGSSESPYEVCSGLLDYEICLGLNICHVEEDAYCCSGTLMCSRQLLPFSSRRSLFENWLVGPFVVAPFVDMVPQVIAPLLAGALSRLADDAETTRNKCCRCCCCACGWLARFLAFIFVLDGEVTGIRYVCMGSTFGPSQIFHDDVDEDDSDTAADNLDGALEQAVRREYDALDGLKELKLSFLFVMLFAPIQPILVLPTLCARLLEVRSKLPKLFLVKRRNVPRDAALVHSTQETFAIRVVQVAFVWHVGIALVAYNTDLATANQDMLIGVWILTSIVGVVVLQLLYRLFEAWVARLLNPSLQVTPVEATKDGDTEEQKALQ